MKPRTALIVGAISAAFFGLMLVFKPAEMLKGFGIEGHIDGLILSRDVGVMLLGFAILNWLGRDVEGSGLRAILVANLAIQVLEFVVNGVEIALNIVPMAAAPGELIHVVLAVVFILALKRTWALPRS
jgi:hypothetical protein